MSSASLPLPLVRRRPPARVRRRRLLLAVANHSLLIAAAIAFLAPFAFITLTALMTNDQALSSHLWPHPFRWSNFADVFTKAPLWRWTMSPKRTTVQPPAITPGCHWRWRRTLTVTRWGTVGAG